MKLPPDVRIDGIFPAKSKVIDTVRTVKVITSDRGYSHFMVDGIRFDPYTPDMLLDFICEELHSFCSCTQGEFDSLLKCFSKQQLVELQLTGQLQHKKSHLFYYFGALRIRRGIENYYLWNISHFLRLDFPSDKIPEIGTVFLFELSRLSLPYLSFSTPASYSRKFLELDPGVQEELRYCHRLSTQLLALFYNHSYGPRMESAGIGTESMYHYDKVRSHLNLMREQKSLIGARRVSSTTYHEESDYGIYKVTANIPKKYKFNPLPTKSNEDNIFYPSGKLTGWYPKPYIDLLEELNIKFKVHNAIEFTCREHSTPYQPWADAVEKLLEKSSELIELKILYSSAVGSSRSLYDSLSIKTGELQHRARSCFNPILYSNLMAQQNVGVWKAALSSDAEAIRVDAISTKKRIKSPEFGMKLKTDGETTFLTPHYKSYPGYEYWWEQIDRCRDKEGVEVSYELRFPLRLAAYDPRALGRKITATRIIKPLYGARDGEKIDKVGKLLDKWYPSSPSNSPPKLQANDRLVDYMLSIRENQ